MCDAVQCCKSWIYSHSIDAVCLRACAVACQHHCLTRTELSQFSVRSAYGRHPLHVLIAQAGAHRRLPFFSSRKMARTSCSLWITCTTVVLACAAVCEHVSGTHAVSSTPTGAPTGGNRSALAEYPPRVVWKNTTLDWFRFTRDGDTAVVGEWAHAHARTQSRLVWAHRLLGHCI
jgi:hypothetical protein